MNSLKVNALCSEIGELEGALLLAMGLGRRNQPDLVRIVSTFVQMAVRRSDFFLMKTYPNFVK